MKTRSLFCCLSIALYFLIVIPVAKGQPAPAKTDPPAPRTKDGKKLLTAMDLMKIASVSTPRISPDGSRVAYAVSETKMEKDKEWKNFSQIWMVTTDGGKARQYTRGDKSASALVELVTHEDVKLNASLLHVKTSYPYLMHTFLTCV